MIHTAMSEQLHLAPSAIAWHEHIVLCGLGTAGLRVAEGLVRAGATVVVVDSGGPTSFRRVLDAHRVPVIEGDCTDAAVLRRAGIEHASTLVVMIDDDMVSLRAALVARELNPDMRLVIRLFNQRLSTHLARLPVRISGISLSAAAAEVFTLAARCRSMRGAFNVDGRLCVLARMTVGDGPPRNLAHWRRLGLAVAGCTGPDGSTLVCPPPGFVPRPGSRLLVVGAPERLLHLDDAQTLAHALAEPAWLATVPDRPVALPRPRGPAQARPVLYLTAIWRQSHSMLRFALLALPAILAAGILTFHVALGLSAVDALYFTVSLVTTVGFGDFNLAHASTPIKLVGVMLMLLGTAILALLYALIADLVLTSRLEDLVGRRPETVSDHYVVAGVGTVGYQVVAALHAAGEQVVAIESSEGGRFVPQVRALGVPVVFGNTALEETLGAARIAQARALIAVTTDDLANTEAVLNARALRPDIHIVLRVFDPDLAAQARQGLGIPCTFSPASIGAPAFVRAALDHDAPQLVPLPVDREHGQLPLFLSVTTHTVAPGDELCGRTLGAIAEAYRGMVVHYRRVGDDSAVEFAPDPDLRVAQGDRVVLGMSAAG